jgi:predicted NACHT family NTPase
MLQSSYPALRDHTRLVVLGDPGCGKTTLLKYLALTFARTQRDEGDLVTQRLELDEKRLPILLPLRDFAKHLQKNHPDPSTDGPKLLLNFLNTYFENQEIKLPDRFFADRLQQGGCLVLLDGVDEVADLPTRYRIARMVEKFTIAYPQNRYVVTSRIVGYTDAARLGEQYEVTTVRDFTWDDVVRFVTYWNRSIEIALADGRTAYAQQQARQQTEILLKAIEGNERVRELAVNPLMLTVIALVQRYRAQLPERRAELYEEAVEVLLSHWDVAKGLSASMTVAGRELDAGDRRSLLEPIALWMMEQHAREIEADELRRQLGQRFTEMMNDPQQARKVVDAFLLLINERSGLLAERGQGVYAFSHLTFQEHLAARAVSDKADYIQYTLKRMSDSWWREVVLLEAGYLSMQGKQRTRPIGRLWLLKSRNLTQFGVGRRMPRCGPARDKYPYGKRSVACGETPASTEQEKKWRQTGPPDLPALIRARRVPSLRSHRRRDYRSGVCYGEPVRRHGGRIWMGAAARIRQAHASTCPRSRSPECLSRMRSTSCLSKPRSIKRQDTGKMARSRAALKTIR